MLSLLSLWCALKCEENEQNREIQIMLIQILSYDLYYDALNATELFCEHNALSTQLSLKLQARRQGSTSCTSVRQLPIL